VRHETSTAARILAPIAFLLAVTVLVLLVRSALDSEPVAATETAPTETQPAETEQEPPAQDEPAETEEPEQPNPPAETQPPADAEYYTIASGDTLEAIATRHETTVERLLELNPGIDPVALTVGQRIRVS
jgi:LysM repeat protein